LLLHSRLRLLLASGADLLPLCGQILHLLLTFCPDLLLLRGPILRLLLALRPNLLLLCRFVLRLLLPFSLDRRVVGLTLRAPLGLCVGLIALG
jgi:hypothetical protein